MAEFGAGLLLKYGLISSSFRCWRAPQMIFTQSKPGCWFSDAHSDFPGSFLEFERRKAHCHRNAEVQEAWIRSGWKIWKLLANPLRTEGKGWNWHDFASRWPLRARRASDRQRLTTAGAKSCLAASAMPRLKVIDGGSAFASNIELSEMRANGNWGCEQRARAKLY